MRCLSIQQPWPWLILSGHKPVENRTWATDYRGPVAIHAGRSRSYMADIAQIEEEFGVSIPLDELRFGEIVGVVDMVDCVTSHPSRFFFGPYGFVFANPRRLARPIPLRGLLGLFNLPPALAEQCR